MPGLRFRLRDARMAPARRHLVVGKMGDGSNGGMRMNDLYATRASLLFAETIEGRLLDQMDADARAGIQVDEVKYEETYTRWAALVEQRLLADEEVLEADIEAVEQISTKLEIVAGMATICDDVTDTLKRLASQVAAYNATVDPTGSTV